MLNPIDLLIRYISPSWGIERARARQVMRVIEKHEKRGYEAASRRPRLGSWGTKSTSANAEVRAAGRTLRDRARDQERNNPHALSIIDKLVSNVVGEGIIPTAYDFDADFDGKPAPAAVRTTEKLWRKWGDSVDGDLDGKLTSYGRQRMAFRAVLRDGDVLMRRIWDPKNPSGVPLRIQILESDHLDDSKKDESDAWYEVQGVRFERKTGRKLGFWIFTEHPGDGYKFGKRKSVFIDAKDMEIIYNPRRPGQARGVSHLHAVMVRLRDFDELEDAKLLQQKIAACYGIFITKNPGDGPPVGTPNPLYNEEDGGEESKASGDKRLDTVTAGNVYYLQQGEEVKSVSPPTIAGYSEQSTNITLGIAAGAAVSREMLTNDYSKVNFSSAKMGWIESNRGIKVLRDDIMINQICLIEWRWFIEACVLAGHKVGGMLARWTPPRREMVDSLKDTQAYALQIDNGLTTASEVIRESGRDPEAVFNERAREIKKFKELGIPLPGSSAKAADGDSDEDDGKAPVKEGDS